MRSIQEAGGILRGEITDYESFVVERQPKSKALTALAVFVGKDDELVSGKIYPVRILPSGSFVVRDESGESVICDKTDFLIAKFQPKAEKLLRELVSA